MTKLTPVGFFRELPHGQPDGPGLVPRPAAAPDEERLAGYLEAGALLVASTGLAWDVLAPGPPIGSPDVLTDGTFAWPGDLAHYLRRHHVELPEALWAHARARCFQGPKDLDLAQLEL